MLALSRSKLVGKSRTAPAVKHQTTSADKHPMASRTKIIVGGTKGWGDFYGEKTRTTETTYSWWSMIRGGTIQ